LFHGDSGRKGIELVCKTGRTPSKHCTGVQRQRFAGLETCDTAGVEAYGYVARWERWLNAPV